MDELIIDEKKYISSKQAAKITGYAKDYVGQLCREGRVPAQLVGRSWYVLESAIKDHRFGTETVTEDEQVEAFPVSGMLGSAWETVKYETTAHEPLPQVYRDESPDATDADDTNVEDAVSETQEEDQEPSITVVSAYDVPEANVSTSHTADVEDRVVEPPVPTEEDTTVAAPIKLRKNRRFHLGYAAVRLASTLLALTSVVIAVANSGAIDAYLTSDSRVHAVAGISVYNK